VKSVYYGGAECTYININENKIFKNKHKEFIYRLQKTTRLIAHSFLINHDLSPLKTTTRQLDCRQVELTNGLKFTSRDIG